MCIALLPDLGYFAHTLQLVLSDRVLPQRAVIDMITTTRKIVGHFRHSCLANDHLRNIQANFRLPQHRLIQDEPTWCNLTLHMLWRIKGKRALTAYEYELVNNHSLPQTQLKQNHLQNDHVF